MPESSDVLGKALWDYFYDQMEGPLVMHTSYGPPEEMPIEVFFRELEDMPELEHRALALCQGRILDVGAGAGCHSLVLQGQGLQVRALDQSRLACRVMEAQGLRQVTHSSLNQHEGTYDTLLLLMNGLGLAGTLAGLEP